MRKRDVDIINTLLLILIVASVLVLVGVINIFLNEGLSNPTIAWGVCGIFVIVISLILRKVYNKKKASRICKEETEKKG